MTEALGTTLPALLDEIARGRTHNVMASVAAAASAQEGVMGWGLFNGVVCSEGCPPRARMTSSTKGGAPLTFPTSVLAHAPQFPFMIDICGAWQVPKKPAAKVRPHAAPSDAPCRGHFAAVTSSQSAAAAARSLTNSTLVIVPGQGTWSCANPHACGGSWRRSSPSRMPRNIRVCRRSRRRRNS